MRMVGAAEEPNQVRSVPTASMAASMESRRPEMLISVTGKATSPRSIQKPAAPREKSPVVGLKPKPIIVVR